MSRQFQSGKASQAEESKLFLITRQVQSLQVSQTVGGSVVNLGDLVVAEEQQLEVGSGAEGVPGHLPEIIEGQVQAGEGHQSAGLPPADANAEVGDVLDVVAGHVEIGEAGDGAQFPVREPPDAAVSERETPEMGET